PQWICPFLVISAVGISVLVVVAVFLMLTKFRPHLQEAKEYAEWLKDERRFSIQTVESVERIEALEIRQRRKGRGKPQIASAEKRDLRTVTVQQVVVSLSRLEGFEKVLVKLRQLGFDASVYESPDPSEKGLLKSSEHEAIWIGRRVPPAIAA